MVLLLKNLQNLPFFYEQTKIKHLINILNLPVRNNWRKWKKKKLTTYQLRTAFLLANWREFRKTENLHCKSWQTYAKANKSRSHFVPVTKVMQSETFSPSEYLQKCPLRNKYTQHVQFSINRNKPWKSPLDIG